MRVVREYKNELVGRVRFMSALVVVVLIAIVSGFWFVQVVDGAYYRELAENNRLRRVPLRAPRGLIFDRQGRELAQNIPSYQLMIDRSRAVDLERSLDFAARILERPREELAGRLDSHANVPAFRPVLLAPRLTLSEVARVSAAALEYPEFEIEVQHLRLYRRSTQAAHVLGYLGEVTEEEIDENPEVYDPGDLIGKRGVEETFDLHLRGRDGQRLVVVDSRGKVLEEYGRDPAEKGGELELALDLGLQQEAERQLAGQVGAVVAMNPKTGEILALYSSPSYNPNVFSRGLTQEDWRALLEAEHNPLQNRAIQNTHPPGSVFKIVMAVAGLGEGAISTGSRTFCGGSTVIYGHRRRCWKPGGHGSVDVVGALKGSCNVFFYHLGEKLGVERIAKYARMLGFGGPTGVRLGGEKPGLVPDDEWSQRIRKTPWYPGETISLAVGQGALLVSPIQAARMMAAIANGGTLVEPRLTRGALKGQERLPIDTARILPPVQEGVEEVMQPGGTAYWRAHIEGLPMAGKTGTAQVIATATRIKPEQLPFEQRPHGWFVSYAPADDPQIAVAVLVEHGGSGSRAASPVAKALFETYFGLREKEETEGDGTAG